MRLQDKVIVITGAASGIGAACAARCTAEGARVTGLDRATGLDVTDSAAVKAAMDAAAEKHGRIDGLVNAAGIAYRSPLAEHDEAQWDELMRINVGGVFLSSKHALPHMGSGGSIVHMASAVAIAGHRNRAGYTATKGALVALTRNMALDLASRGIRVNAVCPGFTRTPLIARLTSDAEREAKLTAMHPLGRLGEPEDVANAVLFLLSDEAAWITGTSLVVDGGLTAGLRDDI